MALNEQSVVAVHEDAGPGYRFLVLEAPQLAAVLVADNIPIHAVHCRPGPVALVAEVFQFLIRRHAPFPAPMYLRRVMLRGQYTVFSSFNPK